MLLLLLLLLSTDAKLLSSLYSGCPWLYNNGTIHIPYLTLPYPTPYTPPPILRIENDSERPFGQLFTIVLPLS